MMLGTSSSDLSLNLKPVKVNQEQEGSRLSASSRRRVSRDISMENYSSSSSSSSSSVDQVYYGGKSTAAVPFTWESQPGTPKIIIKSSFSSSSLGKNYNPVPTLTPPPSYHYFKKPISSKKKQSKFNLSSMWSSSSSNNDNNDSMASSSNLSRQIIGFSSTPRSSFGSKIIFDGEEDGYGSPLSTLCFGGGRSSSRSRSTISRSRGRASRMIRTLLLWDIS